MRGLSCFLVDLQEKIKIAPAILIFSQFVVDLFFPVSHRKGVSPWRYGLIPGGKLRANVKKVKNEKNAKNTTACFDLGFGLSGVDLPPPGSK